MPDWLPAHGSTFAGEIDRHITLIYWICGVWFVIAEGLLFAMLVRYRHRPGVRAAWLPADSLRGAAWVLVPALLVLACDLVIEFDSAKVWAMVKEHSPADALHVRVTGRQFAWSFTYAGPDGRFGTDDDVASPGELHVPPEPVVLELESADVIHSFYVPELRLKQDVVPGRRISAWFEASREGSFTIACAEICGASHTYMAAKLVVENPAAFTAWMQSRRPS